MAKAEATEVVKKPKTLSRRDRAAIEIMGRLVDKQMVDAARMGSDVLWREAVAKQVANAVYAADLLIKELDKEPS